MWWMRYIQVHVCCIWWTNLDQWILNLFGYKKCFTEQYSRYQETVSQSTFLFKLSRCSKTTCCSQQNRNISSTWRQVVVVVFPTRSREEKKKEALEHITEHAKTFLRKASVRKRRMKSRGEAGFGSVAWWWWWCWLQTPVLRLVCPSLKTSSVEEIHWKKKKSLNWSVMMFCMHLNKLKKFKPSPSNRT